jgi:intergrase/recombinase
MRRNWKLEKYRPANQSTLFGKTFRMTKRLRDLHHHREELDTFLRTTKNVFFSLIPGELIDEIAASEPITYSMLKGRLYRREIRMRVDELRDHWGTFMLDHGLKREEVDLLQGRVGKSIFVRHYWSPAITELRDRVFRALDQLRTEL